MAIWEFVLLDDELSLGNEVPAHAWKPCTAGLQNQLLREHLPKRLFVSGAVNGTYPNATYKFELKSFVKPVAHYAHINRKTSLFPDMLLREVDKEQFVVKFEVLAKTNDMQWHARLVRAFSGAVACEFMFNPSCTVNQLHKTCIDKLCEHQLMSSMQAKLWICHMDKFFSSCKVKLLFVPGVFETEAAVGEYEKRKELKEPKEPKPKRARTGDGDAGLSV